MLHLFFMVFMVSLTLLTHLTVIALMVFISVMHLIYKKILNRESSIKKMR